MDALAPKTTKDVADAIADAVHTGARLEIRGGGTKAAAGAPRSGTRVLSMAAMAGLVDYSPAELVLTARAGTPLAEIESLLAAHGQMLAFEPFESGPIWGGKSVGATLGGVVAASVAGPRRVSAGAARDHLLGFEAVSGRGETFIAGGRVVKNVTGYDLPKLMAGSWGRLAALTVLTLKVVPRPQAAVSIACAGLDPAGATALMARAMVSTAVIAAAAHVPGSLADGGKALTVLRIEGFEASIPARARLLIDELSAYGTTGILSPEDAATLWDRVRTVSALDGRPQLWRIAVPPSSAPRLLSALEPIGADWLLDWAGGLVWIALGGHDDAVRAAAADGGGHATLVRATPDVRALTAMFHPQPRVAARLSARVRRAFDPNGVFEAGRFLDYPDAD